jgi:hypothetical protein
MLAKDLVIDVHAAYVGYGHRSSSCLRGGIGGLLSDTAIMLLLPAPVNDSTFRAFPAACEDRNVLWGAAV